VGQVHDLGRERNLAVSGVDGGAHGKRLAATGGSSGHGEMSFQGVRGWRDAPGQNGSAETVATSSCSSSSAIAAAAACASLVMRRRILSTSLRCSWMPSSVWNRRKSLRYS